MKKITMSAILLGLACLTGCTQSVSLQFVDAQTGAPMANLPVRHVKSEFASTSDPLLSYTAGRQFLGEQVTDQNGVVHFDKVPNLGWFECSASGYWTAFVVQTWPDVRYTKVNRDEPALAAMQTEGVNVVPMEHVIIPKF